VITPPAAKIPPIEVVKPIKNCKKDSFAWLILTVTPASVYSK